MFPFVDVTSNMIKGCDHGCTYCWARPLAETRLVMTKRYHDGFKIALVKEELQRHFAKGKTVFVSSMGDAFCSSVPTSWILSVMESVRQSPDARFLFLTKNPRRYHEFISMMPPNVILGATIESNRPYNDLSRAPNQVERMNAMVGLGLMQEVLPPLFISIEPILKFDLKPFVQAIQAVKPWAVAIGYDNYDCKLEEPTLKETEALIHDLEAFTTVYRKTIRLAWWEA